MKKSQKTKLMESKKELEGKATKTTRDMEGKNNELTTENGMEIDEFLMENENFGKKDFGKSDGSSKGQLTASNSDEVELEISEEMQVEVNDDRMDFSGGIFVQSENGNIEKIKKTEKRKERAEEGAKKTEYKTEYTKKGKGGLHELNEENTGGDTLGLDSESNGKSSKLMQRDAVESQNSEQITLDDGERSGDSFKTRIGEDGNTIDMDGSKREEDDEIGLAARTLSFTKEKEAEEVKTKVVEKDYIVEDLDFDSDASNSGRTSFKRQTYSTVGRSTESASSNPGGKTTETTSNIFKTPEPKREKSQFCGSEGRLRALQTTLPRKGETIPKKTYQSLLTKKEEIVYPKHPSTESKTFQYVALTGFKLKQRDDEWIERHICHLEETGTFTCETEERKYESFSTKIQGTSHLEFIVVVAIKPQDSPIQAFEVVGAPTDTGTALYPNHLIINFVELNMVRLLRDDPICCATGRGLGGNWYEKIGALENLKPWLHQRMQTFPVGILVSSVDISAGQDSTKQFFTGHRLICITASKHWEVHREQFLREIGIQGYANYPSTIEVGPFKFEFYVNTLEYIRYRYASWDTLTGCESLMISNIEWERTENEIYAAIIEITKAEFVYETESGSSLRNFVALKHKSFDQDELRDRLGKQVEVSVIEASPGTIEQRDLRIKIEILDRFPSLWITRFDESRDLREGLLAAKVKAHECKFGQTGKWFDLDEKLCLREHQGQQPDIPTGASGSSERFNPPSEAKFFKPGRSNMESKSAASTPMSSINSASSNPGQGHSTATDTSTAAASNYMQEEVIHLVRQMELNQAEKNQTMEQMLMMLIQSQAQTSKLLTIVVQKLLPDMIHELPTTGTDNQKVIGSTVADAKEESDTDDKPVGMEVEVEKLKTLGKTKPPPKQVIGKAGVKSKSQEQFFPNYSIAAEIPGISDSDYMPPVTSKDFFRADLGEENILLMTQDVEDEDLVQNELMLQVVKTKDLARNSKGAYSIGLGKGVVATEFVPAGSRLYFLNTETLSREEYLRRKESGQGAYLMQSGSTYQDGAQARAQGDIATAVNAALNVMCVSTQRRATRNCTLKFSRMSKMFYYEILRDIQPNEALYASYGSQYHLSYYTDRAVYTVPRSALVKMQAYDLNQCCSKLQSIWVEVDDCRMAVSISKYDRMDYGEDLVRAIHDNDVDSFRQILRDEVTYAFKIKAKAIKVNNSTNQTGWCMYDLLYQMNCKENQMMWSDLWNDRKADVLNFMKDELRERTRCGAPEHGSEDDMKDFYTKTENAIKKLEKRDLKGLLKYEYPSSWMFTLLDEGTSKVLWKYDANEYELHQSTIYAGHPCPKLRFSELMDIAQGFAHQGVLKDEHFAAISMDRTFSVDTLERLFGSLVESFIHKNV